MKGLKCHLGKIQDGGQCFCKESSSWGINKFLQRNHHDYLSRMEDPPMMYSVSKFFNEAEAAMGLLEAKYHDQFSRNREIQQLIGTKSIVINGLKKIHAKIIQRLCSTPSMVTPWKAKFTLDLPQ